LRDARIQQPYGPAANNEVLITLSLSQTSQSALDQGRVTIISALTQNYSDEAAQNQGKLDLDNVGGTALTSWLEQNDPEHLGNTPEAETRYQNQASAVLNYRDDQHSGIIDSMNDLRGVVDPAILNAMQQNAWLSGFHFQGGEIVGAQVGKVLQHQAELATLYSLGGMLVYLWFRFELIYGVAAVVACFHDTIITVGAFSLANREISLTVIAAILTLIGYSMNDTIVVFDRIRENLRLSRREPLADLVNRSINQTLSRTVLTSGLTFLTVLSLFLFGGEVLRGFSFALVVGIIIGTYSSIAVAAPMLVAYQDWRARRGRTASLPAAKKARV
jgi:preprotein translocase subunit SecF